MRPTEYKDFTKEQRAIRESFSPMLTVREVRNILGLSADTVIELIKQGNLEAFDVTGRTTKIEQLSAGMNGIRITPSSLQSFLDRARVNTN